MNPEPEGTTNGYWMPTFVVNPDVTFDRDTLLASFAAQQIDGRVFFWPISMLPMFEPRPSNTVSYGLYRRAMNLPSYHDMTDVEMGRVVAEVRRHLNA
jgi:perosamine synthetase